jgi:hypothetical protein
MPPPPPPNPGPAMPAQSLSQNFSNVARAALARTEEGQQIFYPIAAMWDDYMQTDAARKLPAHLRKPLQALCIEISTIANRHFDSYIKGTYPGPPRPRTDTHSPATPITLATPSPLAVPSPPITYAQVAAASGPPKALPARKRQTEAIKAKPARPDTRLFVRIGLEHPARAAGSFALLTGLKNTLGEQAHLLKEVLAINSGFALCTDSIESLAALEQYTEKMTKGITNCKIERQAPWTTYRIDNIPRSVRILDESGNILNEQVTDRILGEAIHDVTGQSLVRAVETKRSAERGLYNTSWSVNFLTDSHQPLPRSLRILGITVNPHLVTFKPKTIQCTNCFQWHNTRSCSRRAHCRICGSNNHTEEKHSSSCIATLPHQCPAKCLHCGGPHPADDPNCPLRPTPGGPPKTRPQIEAITKANKAARSRAVTAAKCCKAPITDVPMEEQPATPRTPVRNQTPGPQEAPTTAPATRFFDSKGPNVSRALFNVK